MNDISLTITEMRLVVSAVGSMEFSGVESVRLGSWEEDVVLVSWFRPRWLCLGGSGAS